MRPPEEQTFDPHTPIDPANEEQLKSVAAALDATPNEVREAVGKVGPNPTAVSIWLT